VLVLVLRLRHVRKRSKLGVLVLVRMVTEQRVAVVSVRFCARLLLLLLLLMVMVVGLLFDQVRFAFG